MKLGGLNRTKASRVYIFSGVMVCGECGGRFNIIGGKGPNARYGCARHRYNGTCPNNLTILHWVLEERFVHWLSQNLRIAELRAHINAEFQAQMAKVWRDRSTKGLRNASSTISLWEKRDKLRQQGENLLDAIAATKGSTLLYERLSSIEAQIRNIGELLPAHRKRAAVPSVSDLQGFLERKLEGLECVIANNPEVAKQLILKRVGKLMMDPMYPSDGPTYEVRGDIGLFASSDHRDGQSWVKSRSGRISAKASAAA